MTDTQPDTKMTEKEAMAIVDLHKHLDDAIRDERLHSPMDRAIHSYLENKGFLAGIELERQAAKGLVEAATVVSKGYKKWISIPDREKMPANVVLNMFAEECEKAIAAYKARTGER